MCCECVRVSFDGHQTREPHVKCSLYRVFAFKEASLTACRYFPLIFAVLAEALVLLLVVGLA